MRETFEFRLEEIDCPCIELHDAVLYPLEIALHSGDRCTDLMRQVREEVRSDFFLDRERFMEIIDRGDERGKFIFPTIADTRIALAVDDVSDIFCHYTDRTKYRTYPKEIEHEYESEPDEVREEYSLQYIGHESSLRGIITKCRKSEYRESGSFVRAYRWYTKHRIRASTSHIEFWIFRYILDRGRYIRELRKDSEIFCLVLFIELTDLQKCLYSRRVWCRFFREFSDICRKVFFRKILKSHDIDYSSKNQDDTGDEWDTIDELHRGIIVRRKKKQITHMFFTSSSGFPLLFLHFFLYSIYISLILPFHFS